MTHYFEKKYITNDKGDFLPGVGEKSYKDGSVYKGGLVDGKRSGKGVY